MFTNYDYYRTDKLTRQIFEPPSFSGRFFCITWFFVIFNFYSIVQQKPKHRAHSARRHFLFFFVLTQIK